MPRLPPRAHDRNGHRFSRLFRINQHLLRTGLVFHSDLHKLAFAKSAEKYFPRGLRASFTSSFCLTLRLSKSSSYHPGDSAIVTLSASCFFSTSERPFNTYRHTANRETHLHHIISVKDEVQRRLRVLHVRVHPVAGRYAGLRWFGQLACFLFPLRTVQSHYEEP